VKIYALALEPIILFFPNIKKRSANFIEEKFAALPFFYNSGRLITLENELAGWDELTVHISLRFPGRFSMTFMDHVKRFTQTHDLPSVHWFRFVSQQHGYALKYGINVTTQLKFNLRAVFRAKRVKLLPGDLEFLGRRLVIGSRPAVPFREIVEFTDTSIPPI